VSADLRLLDPRFRPYAEALVKAARSLGPLNLTSAYRSDAEQQRLWNKYQKDLKGGLDPLPTAPPGASLHGQGLAIDISHFGTDPSESDLLAQLGEAWEAAGGRWGGRFDDPIHFEAPKSWRPGRPVSRA